LLRINCHRGEVWFADYGEARGREQAGRRPCLILSADRFNRSAADLVIAVPFTSQRKAVPSHVEVNPPEGGLTLPSFIKCEDVRAISTERLLRLMGTVNTSTLDKVGHRLRLLLNM